MTGRLRGAPARALALSAFLALAAAGCRGGTEAEKGTGGTEKVGIVLSTGGRGDKGFNDAALAGAARAARELGADTSVTQNVNDEARPEALARYAEQGSDLVVGISFMASQPAFELSKRYPRAKFAVLDYSAVTDAEGRAQPPPPNLAGVTYRSEEGAFLAGALAGLRTATRKVGFIGGMEAPVIRQFEAGYTAGVREVCPDCVVTVDYAGKTPAAFNDPARGRALALAQYASGVDVIFHASGGTGAGVFSAAREAPPGRWVIGVDVDQSAEAPGRVLTSVTKNLDVSVFGLIRDVKAGTFHGGLVSQGLADGAVGYVYDARNKPLIPDSAYYRVETLRQAIVAGLIKVPKVPAAVR
ncbi:MAG: basic rane lipoprotein [Gemmatimonadetes bacterium]|nr:basic rane lipoprotein [Gemmatimonadota bacterium]